MLLFLSILGHFTFFIFRDFSAEKSNLGLVTPKPICYGAKDDQFASFKLPRNGYVKSIKLQHVNGTSYCGHNLRGFWHCSGKNKKFRLIFTVNRSKRIYPVNGYNPDVPKNADEITLDFLNVRKFYGKKDREIQIWYNEDFYNKSEHDNSHIHCVNVYLMYRY